MIYEELIMIGNIRDIQATQEQTVELLNAQITELKVFCDELKDFRPLCDKKHKQVGFTRQFNKTDFGKTDINTGFTFYLCYSFDKGFFINGYNLGDGMSLKEYIACIQKEDEYRRYTLFKELYEGVHSLLDELEDCVEKKWVFLKENCSK